MNRLQNQAQDTQRQRLEADLASRMTALFSGWPMLRGFTVEDGPTVTGERSRGYLDGDLYFSNVACYPSLEREQSVELCEEISAALLELIDERPEAAQLLRGRTFARSFQ
jgi:hypothetical protein